MDTSQPTKDSAEQLENILLEGERFWLSRDYNASLASYEKGLSVALSLGERAAQARARNGMVGPLGRLGRHDEALKAVEEALRLGTELGDRLVQANALIGVGELLEKLGPSEKAREYYQRAREIGRSIGYGFAVVRAQAGLRRLDAAGTLQKRLAESNVRQRFHDKEKASRVEPIAQIDGLKALEDRVRRVYGSRMLEGLPTDQEEREKRLRSMMPESRVWTAVLITDIRGFTTAFSETDPEEQLRIVDQYLTIGTQLIQSQSGGIDKYMGDGILSFSCRRRSRSLTPKTAPRPRCRRSRRHLRLSETAHSSSCSVILPGGTYTLNHSASAWVSRQVTPSSGMSAPVNGRNTL